MAGAGTKSDANPTEPPQCYPHVLKLRVLEFKVPSPLASPSGSPPQLVTCERKGWRGEHECAAASEEGGRPGGPASGTPDRSRWPGRWLTGGSSGGAHPHSPDVRLQTGGPRMVPMGLTWPLRWNIRALGSSLEADPRDRSGAVSSRLSSECQGRVPALGLGPALSTVCRRPLHREGNRSTETRNDLSPTVRRPLTEARGPLEGDLPNIPSSHFLPPTPAESMHPGLGILPAAL